MYADVARAAHFFDQARVVFQRALDEEPRNETYKKALEMTLKAPYLHQVRGRVCTAVGANERVSGDGSCATVGVGE